MRKIDFSKYFLPNMDQAKKRINKPKIIKDSFSIPENIINFGKNKKYFIRTYGCQSNVRDSEFIEGMLKLIHYEKAQKIDEADLIILNTCAIRENAEKKVFGEIGLLKKYKKNNPKLILGMCGCMAQENEIVNKLLKTHEHIDFIIGTHNIHRLLNVLEQVIFENNQVVEVFSHEGDIIENIPFIRSNEVKAIINITYGCDKFCTYCIVPYTRGKLRSRDKDDILNEVNDLIKLGYKEVTLLGQNVNSYGIDNSNNYFFHNLLEDVAKTKIKRIRFSTSNPWNFTNEIIDVISKYDNIMPYIHLPIQSGDNEVLKKMNRAMDIKDYIKLIANIRNKIKNCAISTDIIVGFPNETDEQFNNTLNLYNKIKFDNAYTFIYSKREHTLASKMDDNISIETKRRRLEKLNELVRKYAKENNLKYVNQVIEVLVDGFSKNNPNKLTGYSKQWKVVNFIGKANPGDFVNVKITSASQFSLNGEQVD